MFLHKNKCSIIIKSIYEKEWKKKIKEKEENEMKRLLILIIRNCLYNIILSILRSMFFFHVGGMLYH